MAEEEKKGKRRFVGVHFACCNVYQRIYVNKAENGYWGACPRCGKQVRFVIGRTGTDSRFFQAQ
ncbi:MAG: hypothetical protein A2268_01145 [Candidatus Raymondbacteria bacterium RifOxyA12_full_50_37]|uniref:Uncharacterized protein n=1 Tax=Candidatus Raymondbacteria bacterium RIFOXYD12_FULL_49_13 TaxID=1817890 RepID=A0A1F7FG10_UNCRA|nr:MAG: hypothetical protein A2268_01145 [Candidatus Raymondbacteria bacterium RifOxyA12_full_50_37]OGJ86409.1 MAG: hypothetical protein A2248_14110 [Candidatus Raymondbacteria bacterium RIFOXYA2_FULL_49_16]OGJ95579.1 MAG: hypothetical protein A2453_12885 [Candidatus Raymondbacteria bacterium RIFOXYC2_FULL_50_21]OGK02397.1 MAG: hypothetical protein A2350_03005 [Candidatus Raymondbacteria bacterium RifOxyB12_full_50_8]OGK05538.1 MAG: hypothetical protein A2519_05470 [Candidatus Raymondbacteria b